MPKPWNFWYHVTSNSKSTWLRGDPRGWRSIRQEQHVEGDYKNPPPAGEYDELHARSRALLKSPPMILNWEQRVIVCQTMADALEFHKIWFEELAVGPKHFHLLAQFPPDRTMSNGRPILDPARHFTGIAKKESARRLSALGLKPQDPTWAEKSHPLPIADEDHWRNVKHYIREHVHQGGALHSILFKAPDAQASPR